LPPSLVALTGPLQGQTFELRGDEVSLGRHPSNDLRLADPSVSRHHCVLRRTDGGWRAADLESRRGTFVNGLPVRERDLAHGDFLVIGESTFLVSLGPIKVADSGPAIGEVEDSGLGGETEIRLAVADSVYLRPDRLPAALAGLPLRLPARRCSRASFSIVCWRPCRRSGPRSCRRMRRVKISLRFTCRRPGTGPFPSAG
jgi:FHA domain-containing protein